MKTRQLKIKHIQKVNNPKVTWSLTLTEEGTLMVFQNRVLRIFGPKKDEVPEEWRKLHNEELDYPYCSRNIVWVIKSRRIIWAGHVARIGERGEAYTYFWWGNLRERNRLGDPGVDGRITLRCIFRKWDEGVWTGMSWLGIGAGGGHL